MQRIKCLFSHRIVFHYSRVERINNLQTRHTHIEFYFDEFVFFLLQFFVAVIFLCLYEHENEDENFWINEAMKLRKVLAIYFMVAFFLLLSFLWTWPFFDSMSVCMHAVHSCFARLCYWIHDVQYRVFCFFY